MSKIRPTFEADNEVAENISFLKIFFQKSVDRKLTVCRIRTSRSKAAEKRSLTIYQAKQTVWALAKVSNKKYCNF